MSTTHSLVRYFTAVSVTASSYSTVANNELARTKLMWCAGKVVSRLVSNWATSEYKSAHLLCSAFRKQPEGQYRYYCSFWYVYGDSGPPRLQLCSAISRFVTCSVDASLIPSAMQIFGTSQSLQLQYLVQITFASAVPWRSTQTWSRRSLLSKRHTSHVSTVQIAAATSYAIRAYKGNRLTALLILNLRTRWRWMVKFTPPPPRQL